jgi:hypothetical protein
MTVAMNSNLGHMNNKSVTYWQNEVARQASTTRSTAHISEISRDWLPGSVDLGWAYVCENQLTLG